MSVEFTVTATDTPKEQTKAQRAKFNLEFMQVMLFTGRTDMAEDALRDCLDLLDEMIEEGY